jgi:hypothetical protein
MQNDMTDTQEKDLPEAEKTSVVEESDELIEKKEPVNTPEETTLPLSEVQVEVINEETDESQDAQEENNSPEETTLPLPEVQVEVVNEETEVEAVNEEPQDVQEETDSPEETTLPLPEVQVEVVNEETEVETVNEETDEPQDVQEENNSPEETTLPLPEVQVEVVNEETEVEAVNEETDESQDVQEETDSPEETVLPLPEVQVEVVNEEAQVEAVNEETEPQVVNEEIKENDSPEEVSIEAFAALTKPEIIERLKLVVDDPDKFARNEVDLLKKLFYKILRSESDAARNDFLESGGDELDFRVPEDELEPEFKTLMAEYKEKKVVSNLEEDRKREANYLLKQQLIERLKELTESNDDFNKRYNEFREIQTKWKETKSVPQDKTKELWRNYQLYNEKFYDLVKINNQFRDYDFKKNLELKTSLCETVERLGQEPDAISSFHQLQKLHQQWRDIGPVARAFRDTIWERFKAASATVNKNYQEHFETLKVSEEHNLTEKTALCEAVESIDYELLKRIKDWDKKTDEVIAIQAKWKTIGFTNRKQNNKIFERFRKACDVYFARKSEFFQSIKHEMDENIKLKKLLIEKAESLKDSSEWRETTKIFIELQEEWKKIGPVGRKYSDLLWKQFYAACEHFFGQKNKTTSSNKTSESENLEAKRVLWDKIKTLDESLKGETAVEQLKEYMSEWNEIGYVPFKEKDKINDAYHEAVNSQFDRLKVHERDRRLQQFRSNISESTDGGGKNKLYNDREKLLRTYDRMKSELQTYENNIGFFNISSKGGSGLLKEMDRKISNLKEEMEVIVKKVEAIDGNLEQ